MTKLFPYLFGLVFGIGGIVVFFIAAKSRKSASLARSWSITEGSLLSASVKLRSSSVSVKGTPRKSYEPVAHYSYEIDGKQYKGNRIYVSDYSGAKSKAQTIVDKLKSTPKLTVRYNPDNPKEAVLDAKAPGMGAFLALGIFCLAVGLIAVAFGEQVFAFFTT
jgi:hypothetical protein